jgi:hypothetical protein
MQFAVRAWDLARLVWQFFLSNRSFATFVFGTLGVFAN